MPIFDAGLVVASGALRTAITHIQQHTADPGAAGTSNVGNGGTRMAVTWGSVDSDGDFTSSGTIAFTNCAASEAVWGWSLWSASTSGTCYGTIQRSGGDATANSDGDYNAGPLTVNATAS